MFSVIMAFIMRPINFAWAKVLRKEIADNNGKDKNLALWSTIITILVIAIPLMLYFIFLY